MFRSLKHPKLNDASFSNDVMLYDASFFKIPITNNVPFLASSKLNDVSFPNEFEVI